MSYMQKGYLCVFNGHGKVRPGGGTHYPLHRLIYEQHHGVVLSRDVIVHHKNGDPLDNRIDNLEAIPRAEHPHLHRHHRRRDGERLCGACQVWKPETEFALTTDGRHSYCRDCRREQHRSWVQAHPEKAAEYNANRRRRYRERHP